MVGIKTLGRNKNGLQANIRANKGIYVLGVGCVFVVLGGVLIDYKISRAYKRLNKAVQEGRCISIDFLAITKHKKKSPKI